MRTNKRLTLLSNAAATGDWMDWPGGIGTFAVVGTFGGATITLEFLGPDGTTAVAIGGETTLLANGVANAEIAAGKVRAAVSGGTPSGIYADFIGMG